MTASAPPDRDLDAPKRVVILNATDPYLPAFVALEGALREAIRAGRGQPTELYAEALDMHRFPRARLDGDMVALLRKKYQDLKIDVVVAVAPLALEFAQRHRADIWPGAAIVFSSVTAARLDGQRLEPRVTGAPLRLEIGQTLDLALRLRPRTRRIAVVAGTSGQCCDYLALAREALKRYGSRFDTRYILDLSVAETLAEVRKLPPDTVVLYLTIFRDANGLPQVPRDVLEQMAAVSSAPIFGVFETYLGHGIVAGSIASFEAQGRQAGRLVVRLLSGEDPAAIGIQPPVPSSCIADWRQLRHWDIDADRLPAECERRFEETSLWEAYHRQILLVLAVILAQAALILALMVHRRRLRLAQQSLADACAQRAAAESLAARLRARLSRFSRERSVGIMAAAIAHEINQPLIAIQNYAQAAKRRLEGRVEDRSKLIELVGKIEGQAERAGAITQRVRSLISRGEAELRPVSLCDLFEDVIRMMQPEIESRGCEVVCTSSGERPRVLADALQTQLVLVNLLQNAMHSVCAHEGYDKHLSIEVRQRDDQDIQISVKDRGPGIAPDRAEDLFEPLYSSNGGMGMGLAIARAIVEAHGGRLWHEPNPTGGAIFHFTLRSAPS